MYDIKRLIFLILLMISSSNALCPKATFDFKNYTKWARYNFIDSVSGNIGSIETCPYTGRPYVYLPCHPNSSWGNEPYFSNCTKPQSPKEEVKLIIVRDHSYRNLTIEQITKLPLNTYSEISDVLSYLNDKTTYFTSSSDITTVVNAMDRIIKTSNENKNDIQSDLYSIANKFLSIESTRLIEEAQKMNQSIVKLLRLIETYSKNVIIDELERSFTKSNLAVSIVNRPNSWSEQIIGFSFDPIKHETNLMKSEKNHENLTFITLDPQTIIEQNRLIFTIYNSTNKLFDDKQNRVLSSIVSLTIDKPDLIKTKGSSVKIHFAMTNNFKHKNYSAMCAYWHIFDNDTAYWSREGCHLSNMTDTSVTCMCDHLTHFAVLMDFKQKSVPKYIEQLLSMITLTGLLLSSIGLCLTILTFVLFKKLRRHFSQKSLLFLSINLLCVNILLYIICLCPLDELKEMLCTVIASLLHYFILSSFSWMFIMALIQYLLFVKIFSHHISAFTRKAAAFSQLVPLIPVAAVLLNDPLNYTKRSDNICWLSNLPFYASFISPIIFCIVVNSILYSMVAYSLLCGNTGKKLRSTHTFESQRLSRFTVALSCFIVLGLTWIFGLFAFGPVRYLCQILFCFCASLTGFFIFVLYILTSKAKRTCWNNTFKTLGISSIYSPTSTTSSGFLTNKDFSSTSINDRLKSSSRQLQYPSKPQHFIDAYMPSSPPPPAPPITHPLPPPPTFLNESDDSLCTTNITTLAYESRHVWTPETNYIYDTNQLTTSLDDYSLFYTSNHDATKL